VGLRWDGLADRIVGMADIKSALRNIPEKQPGEEAANEGQKGYIRSFGYFSEKLIKNLGSLQAAYLADQADLIKKEGSANIDIYQKKPRKLGKPIIIVVLLGLIALVHFKGKELFGPKADGLDQPAGRQSEAPKPEVPKREGTRKEPRSEVSPVPAPVPEAPEMPLDLASVQYPAVVVATGPFVLLNSEGKETPIAAGTLIRVAKRSELGTLTMEINGALFVGNESRLVGKVRLQQPPK
jgi:hypothetical protein